MFVVMRNVMGSQQVCGPEAECSICYLVHVFMS